MDAFTYRDGTLYAEGVAVEALANEHGTPLYVYSRAHLLAQYRGLASAMQAVKPLICYSVKANSNGAVIRALLDEGAGVDVVSGGELFRAIHAGVEPGKAVFAGVGKTSEDIEYALNQQILFFTVESEPEARRIAECAARLNVTARIAFRINPDVDPLTHRYISTGKKENKFGLDIARALKAYEMAAQLPNIEITGLHTHIGSQILSAAPFEEAFVKIRDLCRDLKQRYPSFRYLDIGGGIGIQYAPDQAPLDPRTYADAVLPILQELGLDVVMEPGRYLVGNAGLLICRVQYVKDGPEKTFVVVDAGMNDLIRPSLYDAHHEIMPLREGTETVHGDLVGPVCESGDFFAQDRELPAVEAGACLAIRSAGAYGFSMASTYNSRPRPAEVLVDGARAFLVRQRDTWADLVKGESQPIL